MKKYFVECIFYSNNDFTVSIHCGSDITNAGAIGFIYTNKIVIRKFFDEYDYAVEYVKNTNFKEMCNNFIQDNDLFELECTTDYKSACIYLKYKGFIEYYTIVTYTTTSKYFKKRIDDDFTQYICVITMDGEEFTIDTELFDILPDRLD